jgi:hypothetical protein
MAFQELPKRTKYRILLAGAVCFVLFGGYALFWGFGSAQIPQTFVEARKEAANVSAQIVDLTNETNSKIKNANYTELTGDVERAIVFINDARQLNQTSYTKAFELTKHLQGLATSLVEMGASKSRSLAYDAIAADLGLVSEFIIYTQKLNSFLESLGKAIVSKTDRDRALMQIALDAVNQQVERINQINREVQGKMEAFDNSL